MYVGPLRRMFTNPKKPKDRTQYQQDSGSRVLRNSERPGRYAYVVDLEEVIYVAPDAQHIHPKILGNTREAFYAGDLVIDPCGRVEEVTNLSGTFQFKSQKSLCCVVQHLQVLGVTVDAAVWYPPDGSSAPIQLTCGGIIP